MTLISQLPGRTSAYETANVRPQINGLTEAHLLTEGDLVSEDQPLYRIDASPHEAHVAYAQAALARAKAETASSAVRAHRYSEWVKINAVSKQDYENARTSATQAEADVPEQEATLRSAQIDLARNDNSHVKLILADGTTYAPERTLLFAEVTVDPAMGSQVLRAIFPNPDGLLLPNMFVRARLVEGAQMQAMPVPQRAVGRDERGNPIAMVVDSRTNLLDVHQSLSKRDKLCWIAHKRTARSHIVWPRTSRIVWPLQTTTE